MPITLHLIRHCESQGNILKLYSGITDHPPTNHGLAQASRLGHHLVHVECYIYSHIFTSDLQRAMKTGQAIIDEISKKVESKGEGTEESGLHEGVIVKRDVRIREQDFGSLECRTWDTVLTDLPGTVKPVESFNEMAARCDSFIEEELVPVFLKLWREGKTGEPGDLGGKRAVAVVAHGSLLRAFWKRIMHHFGQENISPGTGGGDGGVGIGEQGDAALVEPKWDNTAVLELKLTPAGEYVEGKEECKTIKGWKGVVTRVNFRGHLDGLHRTKGIGSAVADERQTKLDGLRRSRRDRSL